MNAAVVELNALADAVGAAAPAHDLGLACIYRVFVRGIVGGVVVSAVFGAAYVDSLPGLLHANGDTAVSDVLLWDLQNLA